jgi:F-type H+-transporting ATPase subunit b
MNITTYNLLYVYFTNKNFSLNANFLEANVINIALLLSGLVYLLKQFLGALLLARQQKVFATIQEAEDRLKKANDRLNEAEKQFKQTEIVMQKIEQEAIVTATKVRQSILDQGRLDIDRLTEAGKVSINIAERQVREQIQQQITHLAIRQVTLDLKQELTPLRQNQIVNESIKQLGEKYE